jgi:predicted dithiol-disulfide oxidoreductase (DUF899 family)
VTTAALEVVPARAQMATKLGRLVKLDPDWASDDSAEMPGSSCFLRDGDAVFHAYSTYARGTGQAGAGAYSMLDMTALRRQEDWEEPKGRAPKVSPADPRLFLTDW